MYKVTSEGPVGFGTKVVDTETGEEIKDITNIVIHIEPDRKSLVLDIQNFECDVDVTDKNTVKGKP